MPRKSTPRSVSAKPKLSTKPEAASRVPKELKIALGIALPFGALAAVILNWQTLFPVAPEKLVEVAWTHQCNCAAGWMEALRAEGFTVRDVEIDDLALVRRNWRVPSTARGCHPARYMGYFIDGHVNAENLRRLARERPVGLGLQIKDIRLDAAHVGEGATQDMVLLDERGTPRPWP